MKRFLTSLALFAAVLAPVEAARAIVPGQTYNFCASGSFTFCGSVTMSVTYNSPGHYTVNLVVVNRSALFSNPALSAPNFTVIGLDNIIPSGEVFANPINFHVKQATGWSGTGYTYGTSDVCTGDTCYTTFADKQNGGGVRVDLEAATSNGANYSISSNCAGDGAAVQGKNDLLTCGRGSNQTLWKPVKISFDVTQNITSADLYVKAITGAASLECTSGYVGTARLDCAPTGTTTTPEPATLTLMATGLLGVFGRATWVRRRRKDAKAA